MSEINFAYEKLMQEHNLSISDLPEDAKIGITTLKDIEKSIKMAEKKGNVVSEKTYAKIKANDKWVVKEILDFVDETDDNEDKNAISVAIVNHFDRFLKKEAGARCWRVMDFEEARKKTSQALRQEETEGGP